MDSVLIDAGLRLLMAAAAGGVIGIERAYSGREAGFRTHILVAIASALLMLLWDFQWLTTPSDILASVRADPTRMAQGIMTGIGFLGAGVIMHNRHSVRGLTTAASIWITSAIGIMLGSGHLAIGWFACLLVLTTLALLRRLEKHLPSRRYARLLLTTVQDKALLEPLIRSILREQGISGNGFAYEFVGKSGELILQTTISAFQSQKFGQLELALLETDQIQSFKITPLDN